MTSWIHGLHREQLGFTMVEMIVTIAVGGLVMAAVFPIFLVLNRVESTFRAGAQARAIGLLAEEALARDLHMYPVVRTGPDTLVLQAVPNQSRPDSRGSTFCISYSISTDQAESNLPQLVRHLSYPKRSDNPFSSLTVAHGVAFFESSETRRGEGLVIEVSLNLMAAGGGGTDVKVTPNPSLVITPRIDIGEPMGVCP